MRGGGRLTENRGVRVCRAVTVRMILRCACVDYKDPPCQNPSSRPSPKQLTYPGLGPPTGPSPTTLTPHSRRSIGSVNWPRVTQASIHAPTERTRIILLRTRPQVETDNLRLVESTHPYPITRLVRLPGPPSGIRRLIKAHIRPSTPMIYRPKIHVDH